MLPTLGQKLYEALNLTPAWDSLDESSRQVYEQAVVATIKGVSVGILDNGTRKLGTVTEVTPINLSVLVGGC